MSTGSPCPRKASDVVGPIDPTTVVRSSAARRSLSKAVMDDEAGRILQASIGAHADDFEPVPDENRDDLARYALLLAYADDLAEDGYTDPRSV